MMINDFSPMIELAVTLNIAFVAVEYVKSYTNAVCNQLFNFGQFLKDAYGECKSLLVDDITLNSIRVSDINGKSIASEIEKAKITREKISSEINDDLQSFKLKVEKVCQSKCISSVSLWLFLYGLSFLFCMGLDSIVEEECIKMFFLWLTIFTFVYTILGWSIGEKGYKKSFFDFTSLRHAICSFVIGLCLSILLTYICLQADKFVCSFSLIVVLGVLYMYSNFIVSSIMVWLKASKVKDEIKTNANAYKDKCKELRHDVDQLLAINEVELKIVNNNQSVVLDGSLSQENQTRKKTKRERIIEMRQKSIWQ